MRIAVIGAGAAGLAAAYDLARAGQEVTVLEASAQVGGLAAGFRAPHWDWTLEKFYHHWFASDRAILGLIRELGWEADVIFPRPVTAVYHEGRFYPFDSVRSWIGFPGFGWIDTIRFGAVGAYLKLLRNGVALERHTADAWLRRRMGARAYTLLWEPLLVGKFGRYYRDVNMAWFWARVKARTPRLGTFRGGFQAFLDRLAAAVEERGARIHLSTPVQRIARGPEGLVIDAGGRRLVADRCIATVGPGLFAKLVPDLPDSYRAKLLGLESLGAVVMVLALRRPLTRYYWHNLPKDAGFPFLALVEHTNFIGPEHYGGDHLVYCGDYVEPDHEYLRLSDHELLARFLPALPRFNPAFQRDWIRDVWVFRTPYAQPVPFVNHSRAIPALRTPIDGLWLASMSQVYPWDRGTNFAVELGRRVAREILAEAERGAPAAAAGAEGARAATAWTSPARSSGSGG